MAGAATRSNTLTMKPQLILIASMLVCATGQAGPRSSTSYAVATESMDAGGSRAASGGSVYTNDGSIGGVTGISTVAAPAETAKAGYIGQLYDVSALQLAAAALTVNEGGTRQLSAAQLLDDDTTLTVDANAITWSVMAGPFNGISTGGLATADLVYEDTLATAQGVFAGLTGTLDLTVLDTIPDNFGTYAGDGIGDDWQHQYFGLNNPNAAPGLDPDGDGQNNLFEFTAGLSPISSISRLLLNNTPVPGQPGQMNIVISPRLPDRTYTVKASPTLGSGAEWNDLTSFSTSDDGSTRTITDLDATGSRKFYQVEITQP